MAAKSSLDLASDPRAIIGMREFDAPRDLASGSTPHAANANANAS
jgi:hypothetical protein